MNPWQYTEAGIKACTWLREMSSCSCLTVLPGPAWLLLNKICTPFSRSLYFEIKYKHIPIPVRVPRMPNLIPMSEGDFSPAWTWKCQLYVYIHKFLMILQRWNIYTYHPIHAFTFRFLRRCHANLFPELFSFHITSQGNMCPDKTPDIFSIPHGLRPNLLAIHSSAGGIWNLSLPPVCERGEIPTEDTQR